MSAVMVEMSVLPPTLLLVTFLSTLTAKVIRLTHLANVKSAVKSTAVP